MTIEIHYQNGYTFRAEVPEDAVKNVIACCLDDNICHITVNP